ncbi:MAG: HNH endonuclease signature motif containing protein [Thermoplasmata archaeon]
MEDPLDRVSDPVLRQQLSRIRQSYGDVLASKDLQREIQGFQSQRGIYKPAGSEHALWVRQTLRGVYPDEEPETHSDGSWTFRYAPEGRDGHPDLSLPTNQGLLKCKVDGIPIGVFRQRGARPGTGEYEVLGLAFVEGFDGNHFILRGEPIDWTAPPQLESAVPTFKPFELSPSPSEAVTRVMRDRRFGVVIRRIYHDKCSLCSVGYRLRGASLGLDAAHIIPVEAQGVIADVRNGLLLCKNHHSLFDNYAWTLDEDLRVLLTKDEEFRKSAALNHVVSWEGKRLENLPTSSEDLPAQEAIKWRLGEFERT